ncbi:hypothetical protein [Colwellia hornerae]|uniref:MSHA biogenesis protein MshF n=1 Tax=Colwellia hornerae TaxID=89402 RepID=A0A5C6Q7L3_9GAMM|nr:hypothetical protein [Colwellia hornerae]TWX49197.1 hypothetical protein ESZ28_16135 [Colwellia hornerae]TWX55624.1 hypothetical protein ESZ26_16100 [Colwellia hornerae]TWX64640.1 hypothetical protein ESZ27_14155 [Colwellia hornerae]
MTLQQVSAKKSKSLAENLIILTMIGLLMATFLYYFFKQDQHLSRVGFDSVANTFSARVIGIHAQWFMDNKPSWVVIKEATSVNGDRVNNRVAVNKAGWVDISTVNTVSNENECQKIWQQVLATPMVYIKQPISAVIVNIDTGQVGQQKKYFCQYSLPTGEYFEYHPSSGKVSEINIH